MQNTDITSARRGAIFLIAMISFLQIVMGFFLITGDSSIDVTMSSDSSRANIVLTELVIK